MYSKSTIILKCRSQKTKQEVKIYFIIIFYENNKINQYITSTYILISYFMYEINQILNYDFKKIVYLQKYHGIFKVYNFLEKELFRLF